MVATQEEKKLRLLDERVGLDISVNEFRIIMNSMRAMEYLTKLEDVPYLDAEGMDLKEKLDAQYRAVLERLGVLTPTWEE